MACVYLVRVSGGYLSLPMSSRFAGSISLEFGLISEPGGICGRAERIFQACAFETTNEAVEAAVKYLASGCDYEVVPACSCTGDIEPSEWIEARGEDGEPITVSDLANVWESDLTGDLWLEVADQTEFHPNYRTRQRLGFARCRRTLYAHETELDDSGDYFQCSDCHEYNPNDDSRSSPDNDTICCSCYESAGYFYCDGCNNECHSDDYHSDGHCNECHVDDEDEDGNGSVIECYSKRMPFRPILGDGNTFLLGLELEVVGAGLAEETKDALGSEYMLKSDGSLPSAGFEIVSQAMGLTVHVNRMADFLASPPDGLRSYKYDKCGLHVHIGRAELGADDESRLKAARRIAGFVCRKSNRDLIVKLGQRDLNHYCQADGVLRKGPYNKLECESGRYSAVNLCNKDTVELRFFKGNLKAAAVWRALEFADALASWVARSDIAYGEAMDAKLFTDYVLSREDGRWDNLAAFLATFFSRSLTTTECGE